MDDQQIQFGQQIDGSLIRSRNFSLVQDSRFGPWSTEREHPAERKVKSPNYKLRKMVTEPKIRLGVHKSKKKQELSPLKLAQNELQISILLKEPRLPSIRLAQKMNDTKGQLSTFCLPVQNYWQPHSISNLTKFSILNSQQTKKTIMKQLNFIRKNKAKKQYRKYSSQNSPSPSRLGKNSIKLQNLKLESIEVNL